VLAVEVKALLGEVRFPESNPRAVGIAIVRAAPSPGRLGPREVPQLDVAEVFRSSTSWYSAAAFTVVEAVFTTRSPSRSSAVMTVGLSTGPSR